jgi:hypothetical protein
MKMIRSRAGGRRRDLNEEEVVMMMIMMTEIHAGRRICVPDQTLDAGTLEHTD